MSEEGKELSKVNSSKRSKKLSRALLFLYFLGLLGVLVTFIILKFYFSNFNGNLSTKHDVWGTFGDYVGGTLNPIFSFLSFIGLLITIVLQRKELAATQEEFTLTRENAEIQTEHFKLQAQKEDLHRMIKESSEKLDDLLTKEAQLELTNTADISSSNCDLSSEDQLAGTTKAKKIAFIVLHVSISDNLNFLYMYLLKLEEHLYSPKNSCGLSSGAFISFKDSSTPTETYFGASYNKLKEIKNTFSHDKFNDFRTRKTII
jgi:hypothetical protein